MSISQLRPETGCLTPILVDPLLDDPHRIRALARSNGPYYQPGRYLIDGAAADDADAGKTKAKVDIPKGIVGPVFRGNWSTDGITHLPGTEDLLWLPGFVENAKTICRTDEVVPEQVFVNLTAPSGGAPFSHTDIPVFTGIDRSNAPGWLLIAMGASRLFEAERITTITAVSWFYEGERGFFRYWPDGRDAESVRHEAMFNTAVVGDNDFMHHKVERTGPSGSQAPEGMTIDSTLDFADDAWIITDGDTELARYTEPEVRLSLSWKARVYSSADERQRAESAMTDGSGVGIEQVLRRFEADMDQPLAADPVLGREALASPALRDQLFAAFFPYVSD